MAVTLASKVRPGPVFTAAVSCLILAAVLSLESDLDAALADGLMWHIWTRKLREAHAYLGGGGLRAPLDSRNHSSEAADPPYDGSAMLAACEGKLDVLFVVRSASENWQLRAAFRNTLSQAREWQRHEKAAVFLTNPPPTTDNGSSPSRLWLRLEAKHFGDIAAYVKAENSPGGRADETRLVGAARWVVKNCPSVPHVVILDDDVRVELGLLAQYLKEYAGDDGFANLTIYCNVMGGAVTVNDSPLAIPHRFPAPTARSQHRHCTGHTMLTTPNALRALLEESQRWEEDAISGDRNVTGELDVHTIVALVDVRAQLKSAKARPAQTSRYAGMFTPESAYFKNPLLRSLLRVAPWPFGAKMSCLRNILAHFLARDSLQEAHYDSADSFNLLRVLYFVMGIGI